MNEEQELPQGWVLSNVAQLGKVSGGLTKNAKRGLLDLQIPYLRVANVQANELRLDEIENIGVTESEIPRTLLQKGDLLVVEGNGSPDQIGRVAIWNGSISPCLHQNHLIKVRLHNPEQASYVLHWLLSKDGRDNIRQVASSTSGLYTLSISKIEALPVPLAPLPEQRRIVAKLEELFSKLDAGVAAVRRTHALLKRYRQSVLHAAVTGELTRAWREAHPPAPAETGTALLQRIRAERRAQWEAAQVAKRGGQLPLGEGWKSKYAEPEAVDTEGLPELPEGWVWASLPELGELNRGKSKHRPRDDERLYGDAYPFIQTGDVRHANGIVRSYTQSYSEFGLAQSRLWPTGTLCITIAANIADTALLGFDACFPDSVVGFLTSENHSNIKFVELFLRTAKENIERYAPATAQKNINLEILSKVGVPLPPLEEQKQIVDEAESRLTVLDALSQTLTAELKRAERLRQSLLHRAFTGRLVPQDAADEPAAALLARLQAKTAPAPKAKGRGRKTKVTSQTDLKF